MAIDVYPPASLPAGTNNIGDVDVLTLPATPAGTNNIGDVDVLTLPALVAGTANIGDVDVLTVPTDPFGATADAAVTAGATGSISAKLRSISRDIISNIVLAAGSAIIGKVGIDQTTPGTTNGVQVNAALPTGANAIGKLAANSGIDIGDVDVTSVPADPFGANADAAVAAGATGSIQAKLRRATQGLEDLKSLIVLAAGSAVIGKVQLDPATSGGLSVLNATSSDGGTALTNSAQVIKASAGQVFGWYIYNPNATAQFVIFYNVAAASVTVGTTTPLFMLTIPATSAANVEFTNGIAFSNAGFSVAAASTAGGNGAPASALDAVIYWK